MTLSGTSGASTGTTVATSSRLPVRASTTSQRMKGEQRPLAASAVPDFKRLQAEWEAVQKERLEKLRRPSTKVNAFRLSGREHGSASDKHASASSRHVSASSGRASASSKHASATTHGHVASKTVVKSAGAPRPRSIANDENSATMGNRNVISYSAAASNTSAATAAATTSATTTATAATTSPTGQVKHGIDDRRKSMFGGAQRLAKRREPMTTVSSRMQDCNDVVDKDISSAIVDVRRKSMFGGAQRLAVRREPMAATMTRDADVDDDHSAVAVVRRKSMFGAAQRLTVRREPLATTHDADDFEDHSAVAVVRRKSMFGGAQRLAVRKEQVTTSRDADDFEDCIAVADVRRKSMFGAAQRLVNKTDVNDVSTRRLTGFGGAQRLVRAKSSVAPAVDNDEDATDFQYTSLSQPLPARPKSAFDVVAPPPPPPVPATATRPMSKLERGIDQLFGRLNVAAEAPASGATGTPSVTRTTLVGSMTPGRRTYVVDVEDSAREQRRQTTNWYDLKRQSAKKQGSIDGVAVTATTTADFSLEQLAASVLQRARADGYATSSVKTSTAAAAAESSPCAEPLMKHRRPLDGFPRRSTIAIGRKTHADIADRRVATSTFNPKRLSIQLDAPLDQIVVPPPPPPIAAMSTERERGLDTVDDDDTVTIANCNSRRPPALFPADDDTITNSSTLTAKPKPSSYIDYGPTLDLDPDIVAAAMARFDSHRFDTVRKDSSALFGGVRRAMGMPDDGDVDLDATPRAQMPNFARTAMSAPLPLPLTGNDDDACVPFHFRTPQTAATDGASADTPDTADRQRIRADIDDLEAEERRLMAEIEQLPVEEWQ